MQIVNQNNISFRRLLTPIEKVESRACLTEAKKALGINQMGIITHSVCLPSDKTEDIGVGILSSNKGTKSYFDFLYNNAFDIMSIEPMGIVRGEYYSPYDGSLLSKKPFIDLKQLTTPEYASILDEEDFNQAVQGKDYNVSVPDEFLSDSHHNVQFPTNRVIYDYVDEQEKKLSKKAFDNFLFKVEQNDKKAVELNNEFNQFKSDNNYYLQGDAIYNVLFELNNQTPHQEWNKLDRTLFDKQDTTFSSEEKQEEIKRIESEHKKEIEFYKFRQFIVNKQQTDFVSSVSVMSQKRYDEDLKTINQALEKGEITELKAKYLRDKILEYKNNMQGVSVIGDKQVGYSDMDIFSNPSVFTKDEFMGAPPNLLKGSTGQDWNFRFIPYDKMFSDDGELLEGGKFLKKAFKKAFDDNAGGVRIDHVIGLIDPWTYQDCHENKINDKKFKLFLSSALKEFTECGINADNINGLTDVIGAIDGTNKIEHEKLANSSDIDFEHAKKIVEKKQDFLNKVANLNVPTGSRHIFKYLLKNDLSELSKCGFDEKNITGVLDPIKGIFVEDSLDRKFLVANGVKDFDKAKQIVLDKKDNIERVYSNLLEKIVIQSAYESVSERMKKQGVQLSEDELKEKAKSLIICEDLGALTLPVIEIMKKYQLKGLRDAAHSNPYLPNNMYREGNPEQQGNFFLISTHDTPSYKGIFTSYDDKLKEGHYDYLSSELGIDKDKIKGRENLANLLRMKVVRILSADKKPETENNVLLNCFDVLDINDRYNTPGTYDKEHNWNRRIASCDDSFEKKYYEDTLPNKQGVDIYSAMRDALRVCKIDKIYGSLSKELDRLSQIASEK